MPRKKTSRQPTAAQARRAAPVPSDLAAVRSHASMPSMSSCTRCSTSARGLAQQVGISKTATGSTVDFYRPEREAQVLRMVKERNQGPLRTEDLLRLFREIMSACLAQQEPLKVAFLGPEGTFTQTAVLTHFGHAVRALPLPSVDEVFHEVEAGEWTLASSPSRTPPKAWSINTLDRFLNSSARICGEIELRIHHFLMGRMQSLEGIKRICSHQQALAQCRLWLDENLPGVERVAVTSNAEGARRARDEQGTAAIAGATAAEVYGLVGARAADRGPRRTTRRASSCWAARYSRPVARTAPPSSPRSGTPRLRCALNAAGAVRHASHQHDPHRVAAVAEAQVGLRVLHRYRRACRGRAGRGRARGSAAARFAVAGAGFLSARGAG